MVEFLTPGGTPVSGVIIAFARGLTNSLPTYDITTVYMNTAQPLECLFSLLLFSGAIGILMPISPSSPAHLLSGALTLILTGWTQALSTAVRPSDPFLPACLLLAHYRLSLPPRPSLPVSLSSFLPTTTNPPPPPTPTSPPPSYGLLSSPLLVAAAVAKPSPSLRVRPRPQPPPLTAGPSSGQGMCRHVP